MSERITTGSLVREMRRLLLRSLANGHIEAATELRALMREFPTLIGDPEPAQPVPIEAVPVEPAAEVA